MSHRRRALPPRQSAATFLLLVATCVPAPARSQLRREIPPHPSTPRLMPWWFRAPDRRLSRAAVEALRAAMRVRMSGPDFWIISPTDIEVTNPGSFPPPDSIEVLNVRAFASIFRADAVLDVVADSAESGLRLRATLVVFSRPADTARFVVSAPTLQAAAERLAGYMRSDSLLPRRRQVP
jgi:hypothetical protein